MTERHNPAPFQVMGPLGEALTVDSLPPPGSTRLVLRRKADIVAAVTGRLLTMAEACKRYGLTPAHMRCGTAPWSVQAFPACG